VCCYPSERIADVILGRREDKSEVVGDGIKDIPYGPFTDGLRWKMTGQFGTLGLTTWVNGGAREAFAFFSQLLLGCNLSTARSTLRARLLSGGTAFDVWFFFSRVGDIQYTAGTVIGDKKVVYGRARNTFHIVLVSQPPSSIQYLVTAVGVVAHAMSLSRACPAARSRINLPT
jgi:hypothetical protein